jgi:osmoprotectant transport system substrate-binding protein
VVTAYPIRQFLIFVTLGWLLALAPAMAATEAGPPEIVIGRKPYLQHGLVAELTAQLLSHRGYTASVAEPMGSAILRKAQETGRVDVYWESPVTALVLYYRHAAALAPDGLIDTVRALDAKKSLAWLRPSGVAQSFRLAMRPQDAEAMGIAKMSELAAAAKAGAPLRLATDIEFARRPDGLKPLERAYGFKFASENVKTVDVEQTYEALLRETVDVAVVLNTDPRVNLAGLAVLKDDLDVLRTYGLAPVVRAPVLEQHPDLTAALDELALALDTETLRRLAAQVQIGKQPVAEVSAGFLHTLGLI